MRRLRVSIAVATGFTEDLSCPDAGTTSLNRVNAPVFDREALLRKAITNSLEDINRTTPLWAQLLTNPHHLPFAFDQQAQQLAASNGYGATNVTMEAQRLLSRLTDRSPEHVMLQNSLNAQIVAASMTIQNTLGSLMQGAIGPGHFPLGSTSRSETQAGPSCTPQTYVVPTPTSAGVFQSVLSSPIPGRAIPVKEVVRPTPVVPMSSPLRNSEQSIHHGEELPFIERSLGLDANMTSNQSRSAFMMILKVALL